ncbi:Transcriptional regulator, PadR family [Halorubrum sp. DM2]|uniref:helix-turn-helix transcriptional regulator n=1 Tax=Halorubrum sp. DM2 TaxID=2527867 RepID=UPI0024B86D5B|nr:helix-turn-helix transcriptional regulator [Halorubrum sp. DM2]VTT86300.1 Transcriptional regulator, PadR family [Halorubrum sp. DM2]
MSATTDSNIVAGLTAFQRDILRVLAKADNPKGLAVMVDLADYYGEEITHSRLYQNLDELVDSGLVDKHPRDQRTNEYALTDKAHTALTNRDAWVAGDTE